jgi:predicted metalloprotease with PDZ domain
LRNEFPILNSKILIAFVAIAGALAASDHAASPTQYRFSFPELEHHWMQVEASFPDLGPGPLELRMSRSSPGRYALHDFSKNVYDVHAFDASGREVATTRPDAYGWTVPSHGPSLTVKYKVFGDLLDGTYLAVDTTHAHVNMPAAIMWARGLDDRPAMLTFAEPAGKQWQVATQLHPGSDALEFTAPNLQYLMDSPAEFSALAMRQFQIGGRTFRFALHHTGTDSELDVFVADVEKIVRTEREVYGEFPPYEPGTYTFIVDYLPYADEDGMEHRNSTIITSASSLQSRHEPMLDTVAHEFFHNWNVERIRPQSIEPFDLERTNISAELWLAEGFTEYYGPLTLSRAGIAPPASTFGRMLGFITSVALSPAHLVRSAEDMSRMAAFTDAGQPIDRTNFANTVTSYYPFGGAIALALDLSLRSRSDGRVTLDDFMRAMWTTYGKPGGAREGYVDHPYTAADAEARLADVSGDRAFARDFFARYIEGHEVADYAPLLLKAGLVLRRQFPGRASWGQVRIDARSGAVRIAAPTPSDSPAYAAGLDAGDAIRQIDGAVMTGVADVTGAIARHKAGETMSVLFVDRTNVPKTVSVALVEDPRLELVPIESIGGATLSAMQRSFRASWLGLRN